jgi:hypothetical protein
VLRAIEAAEVLGRNVHHAHFLDQTGDLAMEIKKIAVVQAGCISSQLRRYGCSMVAKPPMYEP